MLKINVLVGLVLLSGLSLQAGYVGSYQVDGGPNWQTNPDTLTPQEAAALIFSGVASDYFVSTNSDTVDASTITHTGWESIWGISGGTEFAETFKINTFYNCESNNCAASAYVADNAIGSRYTNFVWTSDSVATPEPSTFVLAGTFAGLALTFARRRRNA